MAGRPRTLARRGAEIVFWERARRRPEPLLRDVDDGRAVGRARALDRVVEVGPRRGTDAVTAERLRQGGEVGRGEVDAERRVAALGHLLADLAVAAVVDDDDRDREPGL